MAPILSLSKASLDHVRESTALSVVSIWKVDSSKCKQSFRSGFVYDCENDKCIVVTLAEGLEEEDTVLVQFENGHCFEASATLCHKNSKLFAIALTGLKFKSKNVKFAANNVRQCEEVVHMGNFDEENAKLNFSSGSVGLVGYNPNARNTARGEGYTMFLHCCSQKMHLIGGPVFNLQGEMVGLNSSQKEKKNLFFSLDLEELQKELKRLFGENLEHLPNLMSKAETSMAKRRKIK